MSCLSSPAYLIYLSLSPVHLPDVFLSRRSCVSLSHLPPRLLHFSVGFLSSCGPLEHCLRDPICPHPVPVETVAEVMTLMGKEGSQMDGPDRAVSSRTLPQLLLSTGLESWALQLVPALGGSCQLPGTKDLSVLWKKTQVRKNRWAV